MERKRIVEIKPKRKPSGAAVMRAELTTALHRALFEEWAESGYTGISLEKVAKRAGAGKAAIYRRWSSKLAFASEAIEVVGAALTGVCDQGSLEADLTAYLLQTRRSLRHRLIHRILPDLYAERARSSELAMVLDRLSDLRRQHGNQMLVRAIERGELPVDIDRELALDLIPSPLYWRMVIGNKPITRREIAVQAKALIAGLRTL